MASVFTLVDALRRSRPGTLGAVVYSEFRDSRLLRRLQIKSIDSAHESYIKVTELPQAQRRRVNGEFSATRSTTEPGSEHLRIFGSKMNHDRFLTRTGMSDIPREVALHSQSLRLKIEFETIYGDPLDDQDTGQISGLQFLSDNSEGNEVITSQSTGSSVSGDVLSLRFLKSAISKVNPKATMLVMGEDMQGLLTSAATNVGASGTINYTTDQFGDDIVMFSGLPIVPMGYDGQNQQILTFNEPDAVPTNSDTGSIYIVSEGSDEGAWYAFENGGIFIEGDGETAAPLKSRELEWYFGIVRPLPLSVIRVKHIKNADMVR